MTIRPFPADHVPTGERRVFSTSHVRPLRVLRSLRRRTEWESLPLLMTDLPLNVLAPMEPQEKADCYATTAMEFLSSMRGAGV